MDIKALRETLSGRRDRWNEIAALAGVSRKTIFRIAGQPGYMPTLQTFVDLERAVGVVDAAPPTPQEAADGR